MFLLNAFIDPPKLGYILGFIFKKCFTLCGISGLISTFQEDQHYVYLIIADEPSGAQKSLEICTSNGRSFYD